MGEKRYMPSPTDVNSLLSKKAPAASAVTIYMPIHHEGQTDTTTSSARLRFKNLATKALQLAKSNGVGDQDINKLHQRLADINDNLNFWKHRSLGLAVFASPAIKKVYDLPISCHEYAAADRTFNLAPLMGILDYLRQYYVLCVARKHPQLLRGDMYSLVSSGIDLPESVEDALGIDEWKEKSIQFHSVSGGAGAEWHGHGGAKDRGDQERRLYLKKIDTIVCRKLKKQAPLILSGTDEIVEEYREISRHRNILPGHIPNAHNWATLAKISQEKMLTDVIGQRHASLADDVQQLQGLAPPRATRSMPALEDAAARGKIQTLLLGLIDYTKSNSTAKKGYPELVFPSDEDMSTINRLSVQAWSTRGEIIACELSLLRPNAAEALLRY